ncbi:MAG: hypothetical protein NTV22_19775, partial [bacterium]|nr:hypothetical protein [bacterium]
GVLDPSRNINFRNHPHYSSNIALYARTVRYMPLAMTCVTNVQPFGHYVAVLTNPPLGKLAMLVATAGTKQPEQVSCCVTSLLTRTPQTYKLECIRRSDTNSTWCTEDIPTGVYCFTMQYANADVQTNILIQTGMTTLTMYAPGYVPNYIAPPPPMLAKTYNLAVHVYNADGTPATAGQVEVAAESSVNNRSRIRSVECAIAANGSAVYRKLPLDASNILVQVRTVNFVLLASTVVRNVLADTDRIVCITNPPLCQATITIQYPPSNQVCWLECEFSSTTIDHLQRCAPRCTLQTSTASVWRVESILTGMYVFIAQFSSGARVQTNITITIATRAIQFAPPVKATVSLRIAPRIPNMSVTNHIMTVLVANENVAHDVHEARFISGVYECIGLDPDARYEVYVGLTVTSLFLKGVAPCNQTLGIDLPPLYTLRGSVECPERPDARVVVMCANYSRDFRTGSFALALISPGTYHFTLGLAGHSATTFPVTISPGDVDLGTLRLTATGMAVVAGRIIGRRVSGGKVSFNNGLDYSHETVDIADNGTFITEPMTRGSRAALAADFSDGRWTNIAKVFLTNDVIDIGDVQVE